MDILQSLFGFRVTLERVSLNFHWLTFVMFALIQLKLIKVYIKQFTKKEKNE